MRPNDSTVKSKIVAISIQNYLVADLAADIGSAHMGPLSQADNALKRPGEANLGGLASHH